MFVELFCVFFFFKQKTAYEMRISDWSSTCALPISAKRRAQLLERDRLARPRLADDRDIVIAGGVFERAPEEGLAAATDQHQMRHLSAQILALDRREVGARRGDKRTKPLHLIELTRQAVRPLHRHPPETTPPPPLEILETVITKQYLG